MQVASYRLALGFGLPTWHDRVRWFLYDMWHYIASRTAKRGALPLPCLMFVYDAYSLPEPQCETVARDSLAGGVNVIQLRKKSSGYADHGTYWALLSLTEKVGATLLQNLGDDYFEAMQRDGGIHLPESSPQTAEKIHRKFAAYGWIAGRSIHSVEAAVKATEDGFDYIIAGTIYPSNSHPGAPGQGVGFLREVCAAVAPLPVIAIGGITPERVGECIAAGAAGVAVLSPIMRADDPQAVARTYREALDTAWKQRNE